MNRWWSTKVDPHLFVLRFKFTFYETLDSLKFSLRHKAEVLYNHISGMQKKSNKIPTKFVKQSYLRQVHFSATRLRQNKPCIMWMLMMYK